MIWSIIEIVAVSVECFFAINFNVGYFKMRDNKYIRLKILVGTIILSLWDYFGTLIAKNEFFSMIGYVMILLIFSSLFLKKSYFEKFIIAIISCTLFYLINLPVIYVISYIFQQPVQNMISAKGIERIIILFLTKTFYFAITQIIVYFKQKQAYVFKQHEWILISANFTITLTIAFLLYSLSVELWNGLYVCIGIVALLIALDVIAFNFMKEINIKNIEETENKLLKLSLEQQSDMLDKIKLQYENLSEMRHNYVHELAYIQGVLNERDFDKLDSYLKEKLSSEKLKGYNFIFTSNKVIDSIINYKFSIAEQKGISVVCTFTADISEQYEHDVSIILANLLDNAIEYSEKLTDEKSEIILNISVISGYYIITVKNRIGSSVLTGNRKLNTTKTDKPNHGYGLKSVKMLAEAHNGMVDIYEKDGFFIVNVLLNM
ncbi:MAG: GHKL domain-containing protein [Lachnospiraceae bacterium]|nr:GHKL domain-containing protein [Lachnospiraceae bacterium]